MEPVVVTGPGTVGDRWAPLDRSFAEETRSAAIFREPDGASRIGRKPRQSCPAPGSQLSAFARWWPAAAVSAARSAPRADVVLGTMSPFETAEASAEVARERGIPWAADLRDTWALDEMFVYPTRVHRRLAQRQMKRSLESAAVIVMNTPEAKAVLLDRFPALADRPIEVLPNGFDATDFVNDVPPRSDGRFRIVHTGYLHTALGVEHRARGKLKEMAGGAVPGLDILTRSHLVLLKAIKLLRDTRPELAAPVELHLAGVASDEDRALADDNVRFHGFLPHVDSVRLARSADLLFLPMHDLPVGVRATIVPGKMYEYLAAGPPVLAVVPDGDARDILAAAGNCYLVRPSDVIGMASALERALKNWRDGTAPKRPPAALLAQYERRQLTRQLARILDGVTSG